MPDDFDNLSGYGPQSGGFYPTANERDHQRRMSAGALDIMDYAAMHSSQWDRVRKNVFAPMAGGQAAADDWLYKTRGGYVARTATAAILNRDPFGYGSPQALAFGLQQAVGAGGMRLENGTAPGGVSRGFGGSGFLTNEITKRLYNGAQRELFRGGTSSTGLDQTQMGVLMSELGGRGMFRGTVGTLREGTFKERIAQARETSDSRVSRELAGITDSAGLKKRLKQAENEGDGILADSIKRIEGSSQVIAVDEGFKQKMIKSAKSAARLMTTVGDVIGSKDIRELMQQSESLIGQAIRTDQDVAKATSRMDKIKAFATSRGLDTKALIESTTMGNQGLAEALGARGYSVTTRQALASNIGWNARLNGIVAADASGHNGITGYDSLQASGVIQEGMIARLEENPDLVAGAKFLKTNNTMDVGSRRELSGYMESFKGAGSYQERQDIQSKINRFIYNRTGKSSYDFLGGKKGMDTALQDTDIMEQVTGVLGENVRQSIIESGSQEAFGNLTTAHKDALGGRADGLAGVLAASFSGSSQTELRKLLRSNKASKRMDVFNFLESRKGNLVDAKGNKVSVLEMMGKLGDADSYGGKADALEAFGSNYDLLDYTKGASSKELQREAYGREMAAARDRGIGLQERVGKRGVLGSLMDGVGVGPDGKVMQETLIGVASEQAGKPGWFRNTRTATFGMDGDNYYTGVTEDKLNALMGKGGAEEWAAGKGSTVKEMVDKLGDGDAEAQAALRAKLTGGEFAGGFTNGKDFTVIDKDSLGIAENAYSETGRRAAVASTLFKGYKDQSAKTKFSGGEDLGSDIVAQLLKDQTLADLTGANGDEKKTGATAKLKQLEDESAGKTGEALEMAIASSKAKLTSAKTGKYEKAQAAKDLKQYQAAQLALGKESGKGDSTVMESVIIKSVQFPEDIKRN